MVESRGSQREVLEESVAPPRELLSLPPWSCRRHSLSGHDPSAGPSVACGEGTCRGFHPGSSMGRVCLWDLREGQLRALAPGPA